MQEQRVETVYSGYLSPPQGEDLLIFRMTPPKKKSLRPKEVSLDQSIKVETPIIELPNDENKLFDEEDDGEHLPYQIFHYPVRMKKKKLNPTMYGNMLSMTYSNYPHCMLKEKVSESGLKLKIWKI